MAFIIHKSILDADEQYIAHQCNCISKNSAGLAKSIFTNFPYANSYLNRQTNDELGTIKIFGNGEDQRYIINMFAQHYPGKPNPSFDNSTNRVKYFHQCLFEISKIPNLISIAFPFGIGCGLAGGNWEVYLKHINKFEGYVQKFGTKVSLYKIEG